MNKQSFVLYTTYFEILKDLPNEDLGILFKAILAYVNNEDYEMPSHLKIAFGFIKNQLDLDKKKYELSCENGKRGGRPKTENEKQNEEDKKNPPFNKKTPFLNKKTPQKPNENENENENVNVNVNENENVNVNVNDLSNCFLSPLEEYTHEKNATEGRNKKEVTEDKAEQDKGLQDVTSIRTQKVDPYYSEEVKRFKSCYKEHFGAIPFLSTPQCLQLSELIEDTPDFFETLDDVLQKMKNIGEFKGKDGNSYKPSVSFLLKDKNYSDLRNGVYDNRAAPDDDFYNTTFMAALREVEETK